MKTTHHAPYLKISIKPKIAVLAIALSSLALSGCQNMTPREQNTAAGVGIGAAGGALLSSAFGGRGTTGAVVGGILGGIGGNLWSQRQEQRQQQMQRATQGTGIQVSRTQDNQLRINVPSDVSFDTNSSMLRPNLRQVLDQFAGSLRNDPYPTLTIIGHTDSTGTDAINIPLSQARAASVRDYLSQRGVDPRRVYTEGHGSNEPVASNGTDYGRAQNRRVEMFLREPSRQQ